MEIKKEQEVYTCPMHPEVVSNEPGNCPKCGMKLVPKGSKMGMHTIKMLLLCFLPIIIIFLLPLFGLRFDATWIIFIVLASCCILPMLLMRHNGNRKEHR